MDSHLYGCEASPSSMETWAIARASMKTKVNTWLKTRSLFEVY